MNPLRANFQELYQRHLCRHSEYGINVAHLATVVGTYLSLFGIVYWLSGSWLVLLAIPIPYLAVLAPNLPPRLWVAVVAFLGLLFTLFYALPELPVWLYAVLTVLLYKIQAWSHKVYTVERDMTEYNKKYKKGPALFVLLSVYELPLLLYYLLFDTSAQRASTATSEPAVDSSALQDQAIT
jgi:hypothetical protein